jgi:hypothetical protein
MLTASADPMNLATVDDLSTRSNSVSSGSWRTAQGVVWGSLAVAILSGWFVVTRLELRQDLRVWDVIALRFGEGAVLLTPALLVGPLRLRFQAWSQGIVLAVFCPLHSLGRTWLAGHIGHVDVVGNAGIDAGIRRFHRVDIFG